MNQTACDISTHGVPTRTIADLRVSTGTQADRGVSFDAQRARAEAYAQLAAGVRTRTRDRPGLPRALIRLHSGQAEALPVTGLDRRTPDSGLL